MTSGSNNQFDLDAEVAAIVRAVGGGVTDIETRLRTAFERAVAAGERREPPVEQAEEKGWTVLEKVEEDYYDGPILTIEVGRYESEEQPRLALRFNVDSGIANEETGEVEFRPELDDVERWIRRARVHCREPRVES